MKRIFTFLFLFSLSQVICAQQMSLVVDLNDAAYTWAPRFDLDAAKNVYVFAYKDVAFDADPGAGIAMLNEENIPGNYLMKLDQAGVFQWAYFFPGVDYWIYDMVCDSQGNVIIGGSFMGSIDFDFGVGSSILESSNLQLFAAKYNSNGDLLWAKQFSGDSSEPEFWAITTDSDDNLVIAGGFDATVDFDPGVNEYLLSSTDFSLDGFILKLNAAGEFQWVISIGAQGWDKIQMVTTDSAGNIAVQGAFNATADFDPGSGEYLLTPPANNDNGFLAKYSANGEFMWAYLYPRLYGQIADNSRLIQFDGEDNLVCAGSFSGTIDLDLSSGEALSTNTEFTGVFMVKYDVDGNYLWHVALQGGFLHTLALDAEGNMYTTVVFDPGQDVDAGLGTQLVNVDGTTQSVFIKYNSNGQFVWANEILGGYGWVADSEISSDNQHYLLGWYEDMVDLDPSEEQYLLTADINVMNYYVVAYDQNLCSNALVDFSAAENVSCSNFTGLATAFYVGGTEPYFYQWNTGETTATIEPTDPGIYTVVGTDANGCEVSNNVLINGPTTSVAQDLNANATAWAFITGSTTTVAIDAFNEGCLNTTGTLSATFDDAVDFISSVPTPDVIDGNTLTWNFTDLNYNSAHITPVVQLYTPPTTPLGDEINITVSMMPIAGDFNEGNNTKTYIYEVIGSYDPNLIEVYPQGTGAEHYIANNLVMTYTVHFQNTGTAPAQNVYILDGIDSHLNMSSVQVIASSHPMHTEVIGGDTLKFVFNGIMLADSASNEPESHGYVMYTIAQMPDLPYYTPITNTAAIYFDLNEPIVTNTALSTIQGPDSITETIDNSFGLYPNPANDLVQLQFKESGKHHITLTDIRGNTLNRYIFTGQQDSMHVSNLESGVYIISVINDTGHISHQRLLVE